MAKAARSHHCHAAFQYARVLSHPEECPHAVDVLGIFRVCQPRPDTFSVRCRDTKGLRPEYRMGIHHEYPLDRDPPSTRDTCHHSDSAGTAFTHPAGTYLVKP